jgi:hypothetical protein
VRPSQARSARPTASSRLAQRAGNGELLEWSGLTALDAADVGEQLGMLFDVEAERRRAVIRGAIGWLDRPAAWRA